MEAKILGKQKIFQSTPSTRRVTLLQVGGLTIRVFQSTPSTRRVTDGPSCLSQCGGISIHTLHTEGDFQTRRPRTLQWISIHTLHTEGDSKYKQLYHICTSIDCTIYPII